MHTHTTHTSRTRTCAHAHGHPDTRRTPAHVSQHAHTSHTHTHTHAALGREGCVRTPSVKRPQRHPSPAAVTLTFFFSWFCFPLEGEKTLQCWKTEVILIPWSRGGFCDSGGSASRARGPWSVPAGPPAVAEVLGAGPAGTAGDMAEGAPAQGHLPASPAREAGGRASPDRGRKTPQCHGVLTSS